MEWLNFEHEMNVFQVLVRLMKFHCDPCAWFDAIFSVSVNNTEYRIASCTKLSRVHVNNEIVNF